MEKVILIIRDGWGYRDDNSFNAIAKADTPVDDKLREEYPWTLLDASGEAVGLPAGYQGNSEVGHMTIGAGIWFLFQAIIAGYNYMNAAGDKTRIENAGRRLTNSLIGLAIVIAAYGLLALIGSFLGIEFLNLGALFGSITSGGTE